MLTKSEHIFDKSFRSCFVSLFFSQHSLTFLIKAIPLQILLIEEDIKEEFIFDASLTASDNSPS